MFAGFQAWNADFRLSGSIGYGIPLGCTGSGIDGSNILANVKRTPDGSITRWNDVYFSGGNGLKVDLTLLWYIRRDIAVLLSSGYSFLGGAKSDFEQVDIDMSYMPVNLGLELRSQPFFKVFSPYLRIAPGLYFPWTKLNYASVNSNMDVTYRPGFGFSGILGIAAQVNKKSTVSFEINPVYAFAEQKSVKITNSDGSTQTWEYIRNTIPLPANQVADSLHETYYFHGGSRVSFSSLSFRIATSFSF